MNRSEDISKIAIALINFQAEAVNVIKDNVVKLKSGREYTTASLQSCLNAIRPLASKHGIAFTQLLSSNLADSDKVIIETVLMHESNQWISSSLTMPIEVPVSSTGIVLMTRAQAVGSVITYARRYGLLAAFGVGQEDEDDDGAGYKHMVDKNTSPPQKTHAQLYVELKNIIQDHNISQETINQWLKWGGVDNLANLEYNKLVKLVSDAKSHYRSTL